DRLAVNPRHYAGYASRISGSRGLCWGGVRPDIFAALFGNHATKPRHGCDTGGGVRVNCEALLLLRDWGDFSLLPDLAWVFRGWMHLHSVGIALVGVKREEEGRAPGITHPLRG